MKHRYQPLYCEENVWWLCQEARLSPLPRWVAFVSNPARQLPMWRQRAAGGDGPVVWDYHVILVVRDGSLWVHDLDTTLPRPCRLPRYLDESFPALVELPPHVAPWFRLVEAERFVKCFSSDRSHMRSPDGWRAPPPPWAPLQAAGATMNLFHFIDMESEFEGEVLSLAQLRARDVPQP
jgi:hypothetical protein